MTFDSASSNISIAEYLGADIYDNTSAAYFVHPEFGTRIYTTPDGCHMLKLARNTLASSNITDGDGEEISWKYIESLVKRQEEEGLHPATKIRKRHVEFQNEKMQVSLAAQVLSNSSSAAMNTCEFDHELDEFQGASATAKFCKLINDSFDILNSKTKFSKCPTKVAITRENIEELKVKVDSNVRYIENLKIDGQSILKCTKRTGFLGLIIGMKNMISLAEDLFQEDSCMEFLLTYKLSQDHLETFFSCIRRMGGFNDNPTTK